MKTLNIALVTFAVASTLATSAFAHTEFSDRDALQAQGATASYSQTASAQAAAPNASVSDAENLTIVHNASKDYNK